jgi:hypothetical protein
MSAWGPIVLQNDFARPSAQNAKRAAAVQAISECRMGERVRHAGIEPHASTGGLNAYRTPVG